MTASTGLVRASTPSRTRGRRIGWLAVSGGLMLIAALLSVSLGSRTVSVAEILSSFLDPTQEGIAQAAVRQRLPRTVLAIVVGAALGLSGALMQGVTRNPLADPGILGINTGAALAVVTGLAFFGISSPAQHMWLAIAGAGAAAVFVYLIGSLGRGGATPLKLALAGAATMAALSSLISGILLPRVEIITVFRFWQIGGVGGATMPAVLQVLPFLAVGALLAAFAARSLNSLALGDDLATGLGERVARARLLGGIGAVLLCGATTAVAGPIAFVGLVVPHTARLLAGVDHRWLLPLSAMMGAALLTVADVIGRLVARPTELEAGVVTALIGAPVFIAIVRRRRVSEL